MDLSIVIVNWNTNDLLKNCLFSIYKFTQNIKFEVIVVDNGSKDQSPQMVKNKFPQVKIIQNKQNLGFTKANNQGIKTSTGAYILLLNSDTYLLDNSLAKLIQIAKAKENLGALGPLLLNEDKSIQQSAGFFPNLAQIFYWISFIDDLPIGKYLKPYHMDHDSFYKKEREVDWLTGAAYLIPKKIMNKIEGLDETIFMYGEDVEISYRIKKEGYKIYFSPSAKIVHIGRGSANKIATSAFVGEFKGLIYFYGKFKGELPLQILKILLKIGALLRIIIFSLLMRKELANSYVKALKAI